MAPTIGKAVTVLVAVAALVALATAFWMLGERDSRADGACGDIPYELSVEAEDGGLESSFELRSAAPGERWEITLRQGATVLLDGVHATDEEAEIDVDAWLPADDGDVRADFGREGESRSCSVRVAR